MSLDLYLIPPPQTCDKCGHQQPPYDPRCVYETNVTHNLGKMAEAAGIYKCIWRPEDNGFRTASDVVPVLEAGLKTLKADPERFRSLNPANGWGTYSGFVEFCERYLEACKANPQARIEASR